MFVAAPILAIAGMGLLAGLSYYLYGLFHDQRILMYGTITLVFPIVGAAYLGRMALQLRQDDALDLLKRDPRPPIVYMRSFFEDSRLVSNVPAGDSIGGERTVKQGEVGLGGLLFRFKKKATLEIQLARALRNVGPFVTIGRPTDVLAPFGAARLYVSNDQWQIAVTGLVRVACAVVLQPEATEGTWWEVNHATTTMNLRRILMIVPDPSLRPLGYARIQSLTAGVLPVPLPVRPPPCDAFMFDKEFKPRPLTIGRNPEQGLRPFLDQLRALSGVERT